MHLLINISSLQQETGAEPNLTTVYPSNFKLRSEMPVEQERLPVGEKRLKQQTQIYFQLREVNFSLRVQFCTDIRERYILLRNKEKNILWN